MSDVPEASAPREELRFEVTPYQPDGGFSSAGLGVLLVLLMLVGAVLGFLLSLVGQWFYLILLFPLFTGLAIGFAGTFGIRWGKVRSPWVAGIAGFFGGCVAMLANHYFDYLQFQYEIAKYPAEIRALAVQRAEGKPLPPDLPPQLRADLEDPDFYKGFVVKDLPGYIDYMAQVGVTLSSTHGNDKGMNLGYYGSYIYWIVELLIVAVVAYAMMHASAGEPYCGTCNAWKKPQALGKLEGSGDEIAAWLRQGHLTPLADQISTTNTGPMVLTSAVCPECGPQGNVDVKVEVVTKNAKGQETRKAIAHVTYPGEALPVLQAPFEPPPELPEVEEVVPAEPPPQR